MQDPEIGWDNPSEKKAQKLARSATRSLLDKDSKPDTEERRRISALLLYPPNRCAFNLLHGRGGSPIAVTILRLNLSMDRPLRAADRALLWRFRWALTGEKRALTKVLQSVDWSDAQEARQGIELLGHWVAIDLADALELLSPSFLNPEVPYDVCEAVARQIRQKARTEWVPLQVRAHAVKVLKGTDDEELRYYLLQLVQALRYEAVDDSRLANFIVQRAIRNPVLGSLLHW